MHGSTSPLWEEEKKIEVIYLYIEPTLVASLTVKSSESWLSAFPTRGSTSDTIFVDVERSGLVPGIYTGKLKISGEESGGGLITERVRGGMEVVEGWNGDIEGYVYDDNND